MNRIEAVLFAVPQPVEREAQARVVVRDGILEGYQQFLLPFLWRLIPHLIVTDACLDP